MPIRIAIDVMGGDLGYTVLLPAVHQIAKKYPDVEFQLYMDESVDKSQLIPSKNIHPIFSSQSSVVMADSPTHALRRKKESSMGLAVSAVAESNADGCISGGNTGALVTLGMHYLGSFDIIERPALCQQIPTSGDASYLLDLGANVDCSAQHLMQLACLGASLAAAAQNIENPSVRLLNVGSESLKGSLVVKQAADLLRENLKINYQGFVEGNEIYHGKANVIVCDGFSGNIALKASEGVARFSTTSLCQLYQQSLYGKLMAWFAKPILKRWKQSMDVNSYNGAYLLGLRGTVVKSHGSSSGVQFAYALEMLIKYLQKNTQIKIKKQIESMY